MAIHVIDTDGAYSKIMLGKNPDEGESLQAAVRAGCFFAAETKSRESFSLVGCTVAPGFDFSDFELPNRDKLIALFPQYVEIINRFTRATRTAS